MDCLGWIDQGDPIASRSAWTLTRAAGRLGLFLCSLKPVMMDKDTSGTQLAQSGRDTELCLSLQLHTCYTPAGTPAKVLACEFDVPNLRRLQPKQYPRRKQTHASSSLVSKSPSTNRVPPSRLVAIISQPTRPSAKMEPRARAGKNVGKMNFSNQERTRSHHQLQPLHRVRPR